MSKETSINIEALIGREVNINHGGGDILRGKLIGTPDKMQLQVDAVGPCACGCFGRYLAAGKTYNLREAARHDDMLIYTVPYKEFEPTAGSSDVVIGVEIFDDPEMPMISGEIDS